MKTFCRSSCFYSRCKFLSLFSQVGFTSPKLASTVSISTLELVIEVTFVITTEQQIPLMQFIPSWEKKMCLFLFIIGLRVANIDAEYVKTVYTSHMLRICFSTWTCPGYSGRLDLLCFLQSVQGSWNPEYIADRWETKQLYWKLYFFSNRNVTLYLLHLFDTKKII